MRINRGRRKITMAKMQNDSNLQVTFSKRRTGLFKKASELVTFCGVQMLLIIKSPKGKAFSFGNPSVAEIADRFMRTHGFSSSSREISHDTEQQSVEPNQGFQMRDLNDHLMVVGDRLDVETARAKELNQALKDGREQRWWEGSIEEMSYQQLLQFNEQLMNLKAALVQRMYEMSNPLHLLASTSSVIRGEGSSSGNAAANFGGTGPMNLYYNGEGSSSGNAPLNFGGAGPMNPYYMGPSGYFRG